MARKGKGGGTWSKYEKECLINVIEKIVKSQQAKATITETNEFYALGSKEMESHTGKQRSEKSVEKEYGKYRQSSDLDERDYLVRFVRAAKRQKKAKKRRAHNNAEDAEDEVEPEFVPEKRSFRIEVPLDPKGYVDSLKYDRSKEPETKAFATDLVIRTLERVAGTKPKKGVGPGLHKLHMQLMVQLRMWDNGLEMLEYCADPGDIEVEYEEEGNMNGKYWRHN